MKALMIFVMLMAILAGMVGMGTLTRLLQKHRSGEVIWTYRFLMVFNLLVIVGLGFRYLENHFVESMSDQKFSLAQLVLLELLIPLKLAFLYSLVQLGGSLTLSPAEARMRKITIYAFSMIGSAIILASATAFTVGRTGISFAVHNVFEIILVSSIIVYSCYYGLVQTHRLPFPFRRRAARRFFALQAGNFAWVILMLVRNRVNPQLEGALVGAAAMFFFNVLLVLWAHRYLPHLEITVATATEIGAAGLRREFGITKREEEVIRLICEGLSNKEIANRLYISVETVKDHNHNIFRKTGVSNRVQLANLFR